MKSKRALCLFLSALLLVPMTSCGESVNSDGTPAVSEPAIEEEIAEAAETADEETITYKADVPDADFGGEDFRLLDISAATYSNPCLLSDVTEMTGDVIQDSIYERNLLLEDTYNMNFAVTELPNYWETTDALKKNATANSDEYDLYMLINRDAFSCAQAGYLMQMKDIPYLDITQPWYITGINDQFTIDGKMFFAYTAECMDLYAEATMVFYNKQMVEDFNLESPYELVKEGRWTLDALHEMGSAVKTDPASGIPDKDAVVGVISESDVFFPAMWIGSDTRLVRKDDDGIPKVVYGEDEKQLGILEKLSDWYAEDHFFVDNFHFYGGGEEARGKGTNRFAEGGSLFRVGSMSCVFILREMEADFGLLPLPKYDEAQQNYYGRMLDAWIHTVPITNSKPELTGTLLEALGAESLNKTIPVLFDIALTHKLSRDEESGEMLDLIFNNMTVDLGDTIWQTNLRVGVNDTIMSGTKGFASHAQKNYKIAAKIIEKAVEDLQAAG